MNNFLIASSSRAFLDRNVMLLGRSEYRMFTAGSSAEALTVIYAEEIDLLLVDLHLADMNGEEFCRLVRADKARSRTKILLVCHDDPETVDRLRSSGVDALLARPIKPLQLLQTVSQLLAVQLIRSKRVPLRVRVTSKKDLVEFFGITHNLSLSGMLMETEFALEDGNVIICRFAIPDGKSFEVEGEVVRSFRTLDGAFQYGVFFTSTCQEFRESAAAYIAAVSLSEPSAPAA